MDHDQELKKRVSELNVEYADVNIHLMIVSRLKRKKMANRDKLTKEQVLMIPLLLDEDKTLKEVAGLFGVSVPAISYWIRKLRDNGVEIRVNKRGRRALLKKHEYVVPNES